MKPVNFDEDYAVLMAEMKLRIEEPENERFLISDGVMYPDKYFNEDLRIAWILKEAYDEEDGTGGNWSYFDLFVKESFDVSTSKTFNPIIYASYGLYNNFTKYGGMDWIHDDPTMKEVLKNIAIINTQKLPSKNHSSTADSDLYESVNEYSDLLKRQINLLNPNVIIFGNTFKYFKDLLEIEDSEIVKGIVCHVAKGNKLYISAYHPAQTQITKQEYVDSIVSVVEKWKQNKL